MKKIVLITNIPTPYRVPLFDLLAETMEQEGCRLHVIFGASTYGRRLHTVDSNAFKFDHSFLESGTVDRGDKEKTTFLYNGLTGLLNRLSPDAIIVSGFSPATMRVALRRMTKGTPFIIWNGSIVAGYRREGFFKSQLRKWLVSRASGFIAYGSAAKEYLIGIGASSTDISIGINTVDTAFFAEETRRLRSQLPSEPIHRLLSIGYLSPRKGTLQLLELMRILKSRRSDIVLDLVGDGEERELLQQLVREHGLQDLVRFHGFVPRERLPEQLAKASIFLFQTRFDIWGLVLNEAMAASLPVICSPNAGAARDLIVDGESGFVRDFDDPVKIADLIEELLADPVKTRALASDAADFIAENANLQRSAAGFMAATRRLF